MIKKCTLFALVFTAISISSLYAANAKNPIEKPQHPAIATILTGLGIKCMRIPGIKQVVALPFGIACTVYGVNELRKNQEVAHALDKATKKIKSTVTLPAMIKLFNQCKDKITSFCAPSERSEITPAQASELESRTVLLPAVKPVEFPAALSPKNAPTARPSAIPFRYGSSSSLR